ncbi:MAG: preprotein translocase subunit SecG [Acidobacteria bacterium]|nr:preprotein translocase subunit SecG [Acidobacteriota bacterium]MBK8150374.1 preprotein translocase subunit SecG [Acidobacteriota bacterium]MBK8811372.1 preprotein translocase subunit SecG [Acidobacteriota bacterium]
MQYVLYTIFFLSCLLLMVVILLQPGKTDAGALFTSNVSSNAFGPRGTATVLSKVTIVTATVFMISALLLAMPALQGNVSVLSSNPDTPADTIAPATDSNSNTVTNTTAPAPETNTNAVSPAASESNTTAPANANK